MFVWRGIMVLVWQGAYPHGNRVLSIGEAAKKFRVQCVLAQDSWLVALCERHFVDIGLLGQRAGQSLHVLLSLHLRPGRLIDALCPRTSFTRALLHYFHNPLDSYSVDVSEVWVRQHPHRVHVLQRSSSRIGGDSLGIGCAVGTQIGTRGLVWPAEDLVTDAALRLADGTHTDARSGCADRGIEGMSIPILCVSDVVAELVSRRAWRELFLLGRWPRLFLGLLRIGLLIIAIITQVPSSRSH